MVWAFWRRAAHYRMFQPNCEPGPWKSRSAALRNMLLGLLVFLNLVILALVVIGGHVIFRTSRGEQQSHTSRNMPIPVKHCGSSPSEARARGCRFESNNLAWVPASCYDEELGDEWDAVDWVYAVGDAREKIAKEEVLKGDLNYVWVTWGQHIAHCALLVRKFQRAVQYNWPMDNWTSNAAHTAHCAKSYVEWDRMKAPDELHAKVFLKFPECNYNWQIRANS